MERDPEGRRGDGQKDDGRRWKQRLDGEVRVGKTGRRSKKGRQVM